MPIPIEVDDDDDYDPDGSAGAIDRAERDPSIRQGDIPEERRGERIDRVLAGLVDDISRSRLQSLIADGAFTLDGQTIADPAYRVKQAAAWRIKIPAPDDPVPQGQPIDLPIVFEDAHLIVIDKPAGMVVHPAAGHPDGTLVNALIHHCRGSLSGIGGVARPGIVHRLDRDTSGLMVAAKTDAAHAALSAQFADRTLSRTYWAVVRGVPIPGEGRIDAPIGRSRFDRKKMAVVTGQTGRRAVTNFRTIGVGMPGGAGSDKAGVRSGGVALLECRLETGRTHQIRVHLAHIGHPLIGDPVYGRANRRSGSTHAGDLPPRFRPVVATFPRQALHASGLKFVHPASGESVMFHAQAPADLRDLVAELGMTFPEPTAACST
ncbi:RluA family pseudouridine synthase [Fodinicurvata sp. EGI_FJ10296]|uniref:RluA family pseudouridine synthase n=1 Tax=Fodinicurvata sp. EGI_FJ10296 TaxID=3231908 RepID=UPI0034572C37